MANTLSRKVELATIFMVHMELLDLIKKGLKHDPLAKQLVEMAKEGKTKHFWVKDGLLLTKGRQIYVLKWEKLWMSVIKECHDTKWVGHPGQRRTRAL